MLYLGRGARLSPLAARPTVLLSRLKEKLSYLQYSGIIKAWVGKGLKIGANDNKKPAQAPLPANHKRIQNMVDPMAHSGWNTYTNWMSARPLFATEEAWLTYVQNSDLNIRNFLKVVVKCGAIYRKFAMRA
jgi:hypothetical protein